MTKLKQINPNFPNGDCQRTVFACLLGYDTPEKVPNFTEMEESHELMCQNFTKNVENWLSDNGLVYVEMDLESFKKSYHIPLGYCTVVGKSPRGEHNHIVIGQVSLNENNFYELKYVWDTSPFHKDNMFLEDVQFVGFLSRKLES